MSSLLFFHHRNFMNDSFRTNVFVRYPPETIGCACIFLSARQLGVCNEGKNVALLDVVYNTKNIFLAISDKFTKQATLVGIIWC